ncbi:MAG: type II toxin-antitoxin system HipA family toxin [Planctomycetota bacterium]
MVDRVETAWVHLWEHRIGAVAWDESRGVAVFEYDRPFLDTGLDPAPLRMPCEEARRGSGRFSFPALARLTYRGLPGMLADSLPDRFGDAILDAWLSRQGRDAASFTPIERLCTTGCRGMGALEYVPALPIGGGDSVPVEIGELVALASRILGRRTSLDTNLADDSSEALLDILRVGTSAGGARPKAILALNDRTGEVRSGQVEPPAGFEHWILKLDGVAERGLGDPAGYGRIEYAYSRMANDAGLAMMPCRLLEEGGRAHFLTRRFDRPGRDEKLHLQSLCALGHYDFNDPGATAYEQAFQVMRRLRLPYADAEEQFRRLVFNVVARNQDDHTKNIAFLMDRDGTWRLSPAYDVTWAHRPSGDWTSRHQMSIAGKRDDFTRADLLEVAREMSIKSPAALVDRIVEVVSRWPDYARDSGVSPERIATISASHRLL